MNGRVLVAAGASVLALALSGCAIKYVRPDLAKRPFLELITPHFVVVTDLPAKTADTRVREMESLWSALSDNYALIVPDRAPPETATRIVYLASCDDFRAVAWSDWVDGYETISVDFEDTRTVVMCDSERHHEVLLHELAHTFNDHYLGHMPVWVNEGLATYYESLSVEGGRATIGREPRVILGYFRSHVRPPRLERLLAMDYRSFYAGWPAASYFGAWEIVHLLSNSSDERHRRFQAYLASLASGTPAQVAWDAAFEKKRFGDLSDDYDYYNTRQRRRYWQTPYDLRPGEPPAVRHLRAGEIHALWAELQLIRLSGRAKADLAPVAAHLHLAETEDPTWDGVAVMRAMYATYAGNARAMKDALALLRKRVASTPADNRAHLAIVSLELFDLEKSLEPHAAPLGESEAGLLAADVHALLRVAHTPAELNTVGWYYARMNKPSVGLNFAERSVELDRSCWACLDTRALLYFELGRNAEAVADEERAIDMSTERGADPKMQERLRQYEAAAAGAVDH